MLSCPWRRQRAAPHQLNDVCGWSFGYISPGVYDTRGVADDPGRVCDEELKQCFRAGQVAEVAEGFECGVD